MIEVRCIQCGKLLMKSIHHYEICKSSADIEIKCIKCKDVNLYKNRDSRSP